MILRVGSVGVRTDSSAYCLVLVAVHGPHDIVALENGLGSWCCHVRQQTSKVPVQQYTYRSTAAVRVRIPGTTRSCLNLGTW